MSKKHVPPEIKEEILRKHLEEGVTVKSLCDEYFLAHSTIERWITEHRKKCHTKPESTNSTNSHPDLYDENLKLKKQLAELQKENDFLKKAAAFLAKEIE